MAGILYGVGVGPGDPELLTMKAARLIRENTVIALPGENAQETVAYQIAVQAVPELADKLLLSLDMPMTHDRAVREHCHDLAADTVEVYLKKGENVLFLTLGDPAVYSTYLYIEKRIAARGYQTEMVSGIPSFCAAAARVNTPLAEWNEPIHVIPAVHRLDQPMDQPGTYVLMKSGKRMDQVKEILRAGGRDIVMVENCGMPEEKVYRGVEDIPDDAGYYSLIIARERNEKSKE
ncbi:MAG: precorrin-2 C(20)-methyltransferase [Lachnospiraceae bacterium]|nr:precorrin-2 C(20)-methyltransferase [Lachnospiraceae bacterium]